MVMEVAVATQLAIQEEQEELEATRQVVEAPKEGAKRGRTGGGLSKTAELRGRRTSAKRRELP